MIMQAIQKFILTASLATALGAIADRQSFAESPMALELVLAVDAFSSVDKHEYQLQVSGYAKAFQDEDVVLAI